MLEMTIDLLDALKASSRSGTKMHQLVERRKQTSVSSSKDRMRAMVDKRSSEAHQGK